MYAAEELHSRSDDGADAACAVPVLEIEGLEHRLRDPERADEFVLTIDQRVAFYPGSFVAVLGPSGCGKTTLLTILGLLRRPSDPRGLGKFTMITENQSGDPTIHDIKQLWRYNRQRRIEHLRRQHIGFALQTGELLSSLTVRENIALPMQLNGLSARGCRPRVDELIAAFGLDGSGPCAELPSQPEDRMGGTGHTAGRLSGARVNKLSGGEYQRVVLARAIAHRPGLVFVDEPTAALNRELARTALRQLKHSQLGLGSQGVVVMITHDESLAGEFADQIIRMAPETGRAAGRVVEVVVNNAVHRAGAPGSMSRPEEEQL